jgi:hypothetical protein
MMHLLRHSAATHLGDQKVQLQLIMAKTRHNIHAEDFGHVTRCDGLGCRVRAERRIFVPVVRTAADRVGAQMCLF